MKSLVVAMILVFTQSIVAQDPKPKRSQAHTERPDTLVSRVDMVKLLRSQQDVVRANAERTLAQLQGQIEAFEAITDDSVRVKK